MREIRKLILVDEVIIESEGELRYLSIETKTVDISIDKEEIPEIVAFLNSELVRYNKEKQND